MKDLVLSDRAFEDLARICEYLEERNTVAARRVMQDLRDKIQLLAGFPHLGIARDDLLLNLRCLIVQDYLVLYEPRENEVEILHIRHSAQDSRELFPF